MAFDDLSRDLDAKMQQAAQLKTKPERQGFVNRTFREVHKAYQEKQVDHSEYVKLINKLGGFNRGEFNDYIDMLAGAALVGMLDVVIQGEIPHFSAEAAKKRNQAITDLTGLEPKKPEDA